MKISKFKNTGLIFELLSMQMVQDVLNGKKSPAYNLIKKYFKPNSEIGKEYSLYKLFSDKVLTETAATRFINLSIIERKKIDGVQLNKQKYNLIREIKNNYNINDFFGQKIKNYRLHGALYGLLENVDANINQKIKYQDLIIEQVIQPKVKPTIEKGLFESLDVDTKKIVYKLIIEKFNSKYNDLNQRQKGILSRYINENTSSPKFKNYILKEVDYIQKKLNLIEGKIPNERIKIKLHEVNNLLDVIIKSRTIKDEHVDSILKYHELITVVNESK